MKIIKTLLAATMLAVVSATGFISPQAHALSDGGNLCGSGYKQVGTVPMKDKGGKKGGELKVYWSDKQKQNCAVTKASQDTHEKKHMVVRICFDRCNRDNPQAADEGRYYEYAGPVYMYAPGTCIEVKGEIAKPNGPANDPYNGGDRGWCN